MKKILILLALLLFAGCAPARDFDYGLGRIREINARYSTTMESYPKKLDDVSSMINELSNLKKLELRNGKEPFNLIIDYRTLNLEAEKQFIASQKYGDKGTTVGGFGCKLRPLIIESVYYRNISAMRGFDAVNALAQLVDKYPFEAKSIDVSPKNIVFLNATFYKISSDARSDSNIINNFCPINVTLELYKEEIRKATNLSQDYVNEMDYEGAVKIWKQVRELN